MGWTNHAHTFLITVLSVQQMAASGKCQLIIFTLTDVVLTITKQALQHQSECKVRGKSWLMMSLVSVQTNSKLSPSLLAECLYTSTKLVNNQQLLKSAADRNSINQGQGIYHTKTKGLSNHFVFASLVQHCQSNCSDIHPSIIYRFFLCGVDGGLGVNPSCQQEREILLKIHAYYRAELSSWSQLFSCQSQNHPIMSGMRMLRWSTWNSTTWLFIFRYCSLFSVKQKLIYERTPGSQAPIVQVNFVFPESKIFHLLLHNIRFNELHCHTSLISFTNTA